MGNVNTVYRLEYIYKTHPSRILSEGRGGLGRVVSHTTSSGGDGPHDGASGSGSGVKGGRMPVVVVFELSSSSSTTVVILMVMVAKVQVVMVSSLSSSTWTRSWTVVIVVVVVWC